MRQQRVIQRRLWQPARSGNFKEGYSLVASQVDLVGNKVYLNIYKNGEAVYDEVLTPGDYFVYNETIDDVEDITW